MLNEKCVVCCVQHTKRIDKTKKKKLYHSALWYLNLKRQVLMHAFMHVEYFGTASLPSGKRTFSSNDISPNLMFIFLKA